jgi:hypothetical protein
MKLRYLLAALLLSAPAALFAQLRVELEFDQDTYLPNEAMFAIVRIYNSSGQSLKLGLDNEWLTFQVESVDGKIVEQRKPADVLGEFTLPSASRARKMVNLAEAYDLTRFGRYHVSATVRVPEWGETFSTMRPKPIGIATGVTMWESTFGIPSDKSGERPELRKFQLVQANNKKQLSLYVRITDESEAHTYTLFTLGQLVGFSKPEPQMDRWSNLHVLYQDSAHTFRYFTITPDGMLLTRQTWEIGERRPAMTLNAEGRISVTGGVRKVSASDLPPPELASEKKSPSGTSLLEGEKPLDADKAVK